jgi:N-acetyl-alpha-D-glucosaminyl L-malate synthase BshA
VVTFSINESDGVTSVSEDLKKETYHSFKITREIEVIPNFIDLEKFKKQKKDHFKKAICPHGESLIVHTSNFRKVKRVGDVMSVFNNIHKEIPSKLLMIGDGPERNGAEAMAREMGINDAVRFLGKQEAVEEVLSVADLFLIPSEKESFGLAALEAMACEVPVISTNTGGLPELMVQGVTGFMSNIGDVEDMTRNSLFVLDKSNLPRFKASALARAKEFDITNILPLYERYYEKILKKARVNRSVETTS